MKVSVMPLFALVLLLMSCSAPEPDPPPNIIFFIADDMYPEMFNCLPEGKGKNLTPHLDRLAREGTLLRNQYVVSPVCTPSRFNCLTGKYASRATNAAFLNKTASEEGQTVIQWNSFITQEDSILPHYLKKLGYRTGMVGKNHVIEAKGLFSFPDFDADPREPANMEQVKKNYEKVKQAVLATGFDYAGGLYHNNPNFIGLRELAVQNMDWIAAAGLEFIEDNHDKPFFLYFATTIPHQPGQPERSWNADPKVTAAGFLDEALSVLPPRESIAERIREAGLQGSKRENILWLDDALGALLQKLEDHGILDNTIIFFFNDHGQKAKGTLYQGGVHNPSIVWRSGGFPAGASNDQVVSNVDFAPTILEMAGASSLPVDLDGISFLGSLEKHDSEARESLFFELGYARAVIKGKYKYYAVRYPSYATNWSDTERAAELNRYNQGRTFRHMPIVNLDPAAPFSHLEVVPGGGQAEHETYGKFPGYFDPDQLYDLEKDPSEQVNLATDPEYESILEDMKATLQEYINDLPGTFKL